MASRTTRRAAAQPRRESGWSLARFILGIAILAWAFRSFVVAPFSIPSGSMLPTLYVGDYLAVAKWPYGYSRYSFLFGFPSFEGRIFSRLPHRGDVAVHPADEPFGATGHLSLRRVRVAHMGHPLSSL